MSMAHFWYCTAGGEETPAWPVEDADLMPEEFHWPSPHVTSVTVALWDIAELATVVYGQNHRQEKEKQVNPIDTTMRK